MAKLELLPLDRPISQMRPFQVHGTCERTRDPIRGTYTTSDPQRQFRRKSQVVGDRLHTADCECDFCLSRTLPPVMISGSGLVAVPDSTNAIEAGLRWIERNGLVTRENFGQLLDVFREDWKASSVLAKTFLNVCPLPGIGSTDVVAAFVTAVHPSHHDVDLCECPPDVLCAIIDTWKALNVWCVDQGFTLVAYGNAGRDRRSGQSFAHPHTQTLALGQTPALYAAMQDAKRAGRCPICELKDMTDLHIAVPGGSKLLLMAHPAPKHSWSLVIVSRTCDDDFSGVNSTEFSALFATALRAMATTLGGVPAYNLVVRVGAGHFHAEIVPRSTNIEAGAEIALHEYFVDVPASHVRAALAAAVAKEASI